MANKRNGHFRKVKPPKICSYKKKSGVYMEKTAPKKKGTKRIIPL